MKFLTLVLAALLVTTVASAEPAEGPSRAEGVLESGKETAVPLTLLGGEETRIFVYADEDDAKLLCGVFTLDGSPVIVDNNGDDRCGFVITPKSTVDVLVAVHNDGGQSAHLTLIAR